jgi:small-conductance mechanosensitive channel
MDYVFMGNTLTAWSIAFAAATVLALIGSLTKKIAVSHLAPLAARTQTYIDDVVVGMLASTRFLFIFILAAYICTALVDLTAARQLAAFRVVIIALLVQSALWGDKGIRMWLAHCLERARVEDAASTTSTAALGFVSRAVLWVVITLMILDNLGFNIATLVASLGIGGIAVALALQNILGDIFASLSIVLDKPFEVGDFIVVDDVSGTVEFVGLKTTRLRSLSGEQIVFANADMLRSRIRNYKHMQERRALFAFGVTYQTTEAQLREIPNMVREAVTENLLARFDRAHFKSYGDSSLDFEAVYYLTVPEYAIFMDTQQAINLTLFARFAKEKIEFAYPSRTVFVVNQDAQPAGKLDMCKS